MLKLFTFCNCIDLFDGGFSPTFAEEIFVYCILAGVENKVRHLLVAKFTQPKSSQSLITKLFTKRGRRHLELSVALSNIISCDTATSDWCLCVILSFILLLCHNSDDVTGFFFRKHYTLPTTLAIEKMHN